MTLNLLRNSINKHKLSAYAAIFRIHYFKRCPLAPPGTKVSVNENTDNRHSWYPHGTGGWYISPSMEHQICVQFFMPETSSVRNVDTLAFFSADMPFPIMETEY